MKEIKNIIVILMIVFAAGITACGGGSSSSGGGSNNTSSSVPKNVTAEAGHEQVTIRWDNVSGALAYNIYRDTSDTVSKMTGTLIDDVLSPYVDEFLTNGTTYYYVVTCVTTEGESRESNIVDATPSLNPPPPPGP